MCDVPARSQNDVAPPLEGSGSLPSRLVKGATSRLHFSSQLLERWSQQCFALHLRLRRGLSAFAANLKSALRLSCIVQEGETLIALCESRVCKVHEHLFTITASRCPFPWIHKGYRAAQQLLCP